jgi:tetratricopeptide (TPR) repeat protein
MAGISSGKSSVASSIEFSGFPYKRRFWLSAFALSAGLTIAGVGGLRAASGTRTDVFSNRIVMADDFYLGRENVTNVDRGLHILRQQVAENAGDYDAWWRISRSENFWGRVHDANNNKAALRDFEAGADAGRRAIKLRPNQPEGHFWLGANLGLIGEEEGLLRGLRLVDPVRSEMETVMRLDPDYEQRGAQRILARVYYRAPFFKGGDKQRSIELLQDCLKRYPFNSFALLYLADDYISVGRRAEARKILEQILNLCPDPLYGPELANNQAEARDRLQHELLSAR